MTIREQIEEREYEILSPHAAHARESLGRLREEEPCDIRTCYQRDRDRIVHTPAFRRLKNKTQVFLEPEGDHYRTRLTHTLEVSQIARTIGKALALNEDLIEAIALGHDLGHTPYGHSGEKALNEVLIRQGFPEGFAHNRQSVRLVQRLEKEGRGLNLTREVIDGILNHGTNTMPSTLEGKVVRLCDKIAYINHDIDDAVRAHVLTEAGLPREYTDVLGHSVKTRLNRMVHDMIINSMGKNDICQSEEVAAAMQGLRTFMFCEVYENPKVKGQEKKAQRMLVDLYEYYMDHVEDLPAFYRRLMDEGEKKEIVIADYISGMTDSYSMQKFGEYFVPQGWKDE